jgi:hypothetical protein
MVCTAEQSNVKVSGEQHAQNNVVGKTVFAKTLTLIQNANVEPGTHSVPLEKE